MSTSWRTLNLTFDAPEKVPFFVVWNNLAQLRLVWKRMMPWESRVSMGRIQNLSWYFNNFPLLVFRWPFPRSISERGTLLSARKASGCHARAGWPRRAEGRAMGPLRGPGCVPCSACFTATTVMGASKAGGALREPCSCEENLTLGWQFIHYCN